MEKRTKALAAGLLYISFIAVTAVSAVIRNKLVDLGNVMVTFENIKASGGLFQLGFMFELVSALLFLLSAWTLWALLKDTNGSLALLFLILNSIGTAIHSFSLVAYFTALKVLSGAGYLGALQSDQASALAMLLLHLRENGFQVSQLFFAAWLLPLGYTVYKSGFAPRALGGLLMVEFLTWTAYFAQFFFFPGISWLVIACSAIGFLGEVSLALWLVIWGARRR